MAPTIIELIHLIGGRLRKGHMDPVYVAGGAVHTRLQDEDGAGISSTPVAGGQALDVNIAAGAGAGGTSMIDDAAFTAGATAITPAGGYYDSAGEAVNDGDGGALAMTQRRALHTTIRTPNDDSAMDEVNDALRVNIVAGAGAGGTSMIDDAAFTPGATAITPAGAMFDDAAPDSVDEGDGGVVRMSARRELYVQIRDAAGNERGVNVDAAGAIAVGDGGGSLSVDDNGGALSVDDAGGSLSVDDNAGSLTVDGGVTADIRDGAGTALTSTLVGADQALDVNIVQTVGGAGGTSMTDDAAFTPGATSVTPIAAFADEAAPDSVDEGDAGAVRMSLNRNLHIDIRDGAGNERGANVTATNELEVSVENSPTLGANDGVDIGDVTINNAAGAAAVNVQDGGNSLTIDNAALSVVGGGVEAAALRVTIANDSTGVVTVDGTVTAANTAGDVADDAVDSGNPVKIGALAKETDGTDPGSVSAEDDRVELIADRNRRLLVNTGHPNAFFTNNNYAAAQTDTEQEATPGANLSLYITSILMSTEGACNMTIVRNTAASVDVAGPYYFAANGGMVAKFDPAIRIPTNENIGLTSSAAVNHTVSINGYTAP